MLPLTDYLKTHSIRLETWCKLVEKLPFLLILFQIYFCNSMLIKINWYVLFYLWEKVL